MSNKEHTQQIQTIRDAACLVAAAIMGKLNEEPAITAARATELSRACRRMDLGVYLFPAEAEGRLGPQAGR